MRHPPHLKKTLAIAALVGTVLFCINQLDVVLRGDADTLVWAKAAVTYVVPFVVSNAGVLVGSREQSDGSTPGPRSGPRRSGTRHPS